MTGIGHNRLTTPLLDTVAMPADLRRLKPAQLRQLADELRAETIDAVSLTGGHLGAGLGVVGDALVRRSRGVLGVGAPRAACPNPSYRKDIGGSHICGEGDGAD